MDWYATDIDEHEVLMARLHGAEMETANTVALLEALHSDSSIGYGFVGRDSPLRMNGALAAPAAPRSATRLATVAEVRSALWPQLKSINRRVFDMGERITGVKVNGTTTDWRRDCHGRRD